MLGQHSPRDWRAGSQTREIGHAVDLDLERLMEISSGRRKVLSEARVPPSSVPSEDMQRREERHRR